MWMPSSLRSSPARCSIPTIRSRSGPWSAPRPSKRSATSATSANSTPWSRFHCWAEAFSDAFGRQSGGLLHSYRTEGAETIVVALGSVLGTIKDAVDIRRDAGERVGVVGITAFRPFPRDAVRQALAGARRIVVVEKAFSVGFGGVLSTDVAMATHGADCSLHTVVAGLGGRPITCRSLEGILATAGGDGLDVLTFLDLDHGVVERERARMTGDAAVRPLGGERPPRPRHRAPSRLRRGS